ncbi:MAG TPA: PAS domain S-box protein [Vicinamibacterales bacterium]|nr:PAS domain S-box protein [Vicinamibacterales bacterium]
MLIPIFLHRSDPTARLSDAERLYFVSQAIDASVDAIAFTDVHGRISFVNCAFVRLWGYQRPADIGGRLLSSFVEPAFAEATAGRPEHAQVSMNICSNWTGEALGIASNGFRFPIAGSITRIDDPSGGLAGFVASFRDVSDRVRVEEALRESEERYRSLVESARDTIFTSDATGRFLYVNTAAAATLGLTPDQVMGRTVDELFPPHVAERYRAGVQHVIETGETLHTEELSEVDGQVRWYSTIVQPMGDANGQIAAAQAIVRDITTRKLAEERLALSEERLNQAIRVADIGFFDHDHLKGERYWSPGLRQIAGLEPDDPLPPHPSTHPADEVWSMHPEDRPLIIDAVKRAHAPHGDGFYDVEYRFIRPSGVMRWVKVRSQTFFRGEGEARHPVRTVGGAQDITDRKLADADRARLQEQLTQAQKMESVGRLAGGVAHDFNNMLSVISGHAELALRTAAPDDPVRGDLEQIRTAARRAADLTRQLLAFARRQVVAPRVLDLNAAVAASLDMLQRLIGEDIELRWIPSNDAGRVRVDPSQVDQVLTNLAANARDAIQGVGQVTVRTRRVVFEEADRLRHEGSVMGPYAALEVSDTGRGIDSATAAHLFEPFFTTKPVGRGTGLGLATVYGIVKQNDGCVEVDSEVGRGTTVRIFLPSVEADVTGATMDMAAGPAQSGHETVLLVEDESAVLRLSKIVLERFGYKVLTAATPSEAIQLFTTHEGRVHLLVTDVVMPEMNGRELAARLRESRPELKTLFVSGYSASALAPRGVLEEGVHFLQKPFSLEDLAASVREALDAQDA